MQKNHARLTLLDIMINKSGIKIWIYLSIYLSIFMIMIYVLFSSFRYQIKKTKQNKNKTKFIYLSIYINKDDTTYKQCVI